MSTNPVMGTSLTGRRRNRSWPEALKREVVAASLVSGASVSGVARQYDVNANQVFSWRKRYRDEPAALAEPSPSQLIPVTIVAAPAEVMVAPSATRGMIEIGGVGTYRLRVDGDVDVGALRRVLDVLEQR